MCKKFILILSVFIFLISLSACKKDSDNKTNPNEELPKNTCYDEGMIVGEIEFMPIIYNNTTLINGKTTMSLILHLINHGEESIRLNINKVYLIGESKTEYEAYPSTSIRPSGVKYLDLFPERDVEFHVSKTFETDKMEESYTLVIETDKDTYTIILRENPKFADKLINVKYIVDGNEVGSDTIASGRISPRLKDYVSKNKLKYVSSSSWRIQSTGNPVTYNTVITEDVVLEAYSQKMFSYTREYGYATITSIYYVPENGVLVIPDNIESSIPLLNCQIYRGSNNHVLIKELYLPYDFDLGSKFEILDNSALEKIYYDGNEEEFNTTIEGKSFVVPEGVQIVYNTKYTGN